MLSASVGHNLVLSVRRYVSGEKSLSQGRWKDWVARVHYTKEKDTE
jgi:hypothetical protein